MKYSYSSNIIILNLVGMYFFYSEELQSEEEEPKESNSSKFSC